jgi:hypothetical protein
VKIDSLQPALISSVVATSQKKRGEASGRTDRHGDFTVVGSNARLSSEIQGCCYLVVYGVAKDMNLVIPSPID